MKTIHNPHTAFIKLLNNESFEFELEEELYHKTNLYSVSGGVLYDEIFEITVDRIIKIHPKYFMLTNGYRTFYDTMVMK